ncbi:MAG TPA: hypothetical protein PKD26_09835 [Pyrinomonadaceae bacterium]|nr:hypothetical protein [Pyrinomonadaceae bacterium]
MDPTKVTNFKNPKRVKVNIACVYLTNYFLANDQGQVAQAKTVLDEHNLQLEVWPQGALKTPANTLIYPDPVPHDAYDDAANKVTYKDLLTRARNLISSKVPFSVFATVVFGQFKHPGIGICPPSVGLVTPLCIISPNGNSDKMDVLHELGHASDLHHENGFAKNFMNETNGRSEMMRFQVEKMAKSWFAVA